MLGKQLIQAAAGSAAASAALYVDDVFSTFLYEGNGGSQAINNGIDLSGEGGLAWLKRRDVGGSTAWSHYLFDTERGVYKYVQSNSNGAQATSNFTVTAFNSNGFTLGETGGTNSNGGDFASWTFRKAPGFFDVVTYTGTGSNRTVAHSLGSVPGMIIVKATNATRHWWCYHRGIGNTGAIALSLTGATTNALAYWNNTSPTSSVFTVGTDADVNGSGTNYVAYIFAHDDQSFGTDSDESIIKCGSYTGNGSTTGPVIDLGFEPQWLMIKRRDGTSSWAMYDMMRGAGAPNQTLIEANTNGVEGSYSTFALDFQPTGFQIKASSPFTINANGGNYIYMAIRRPHKPPTAGTEVYKSVAGSDAGSTATGFTVDMALSAIRSGSSFNHAAMSRLQPDRSILSTYRTNAEEVNFTNAGAFATNDGMKSRALWGTSIYHFFKRAPGFFDIVATTITGSSTNVRINHNLTVVPEMIIAKRRSGVNSWFTYFTSLTRNYFVTLNTNGVATNIANSWGTSDPTTTDFGWNANWLGDGDTIYYLFATLPDISKVGSYTGTGNAINVDCGFSSGARFILIKRTDATGDWFVYDSARGIVSGNDPYLLLNSNAAEVTNTDYIDPLSSGFTVTSSAPTGLNASGGTYIFLAIA